MAGAASTPGPIEPVPVQPDLSASAPAPDEPSAPAPAAEDADAPITLQPPEPVPGQPAVAEPQAGDPAGDTPANTPEPQRARLFSEGATNALLAFLKSPSTAEADAAPGESGRPAPQTQPDLQRTRKRTPMQQTLRELRTRGPGWLMSAGIHLVVMLLMAQLVVIVRYPQKMRSILVSFGMAETETPGETEKPELEETEPAPPKQDTTDEEAKPVPDPGSTPDAQPAKPDPKPAEEQSPGPDATEPKAASDGPPPAPAAFANRTGTGKSDALRKYGGSAETEAAVERGLAWLARHQQPNGRWSGARFHTRCPARDQCGDAGWDGYDTAHTALAVMCFLGAGHLPKTEPYGEQVQHGIDFLLSQQGVDGSIGPQRSTNQMYNHGMAALALCEATALTADPNTRAGAKRAIGYIVSAQQAGGGWDYRGRDRTNRNDLSVAGWQVMALKSALVAGIDVPSRTWNQTRKFLWRMRKGVDGRTRADGEYRYADAGFQGFGDQVRYGPGMTAVGLLCQLYTGTEPGDPQVARSAQRIAAEPPSFELLQTEELHTVYYWYYGTLALFQWGGEPWREWNHHMRQVLTSTQVLQGHARGSWDPKGVWLGQYGGRLYSTTFNILNLEVYYRYLPIYRTLGRAPTPDPLEVNSEKDALAKAGAKSAGVRFAAVQKLSESDGDEAFKTIKAALNDKNSMVRWQAIKALTKRSEEECTDLLLAQLAREQGDLRRVIVDALGKRGDKKAVPRCLAALNDPDAEVRRRASRALGKLTGQSFGLDYRAWKRWWDAEQRRKGG